MKKWIKNFLRLILFLFVTIALYGLSAWLLPKITVNKNRNLDNTDIEIFILSNGVHTDIVLPIKNELKDWSLDVPFEDTKGKNTDHRYLAFGWGDKGFYLETPTWADLKFRTAFKAAFALSNSAMHTTFYKKIKLGEDCKSIKVKKEEYLKLVEFIENSFEKDSLHRAIPIKTDANYGLNDAFYEAKGKYSLLHTCNTWSNNALKESGLKACLWTPFDKGIFEKYN